MGPVNASASLSFGAIRVILAGSISMIPNSSSISRFRTAIRPTRRSVCGSYAQRSAAVDMRKATGLGPSLWRRSLTPYSLVLRTSSPLVRLRNSMGEQRHLKAAACAALDLPAAERIERMRRPRRIGYTRAKQLLDKLDDLLTHPKTHRMPNLLIVGDTNAGKTMLANRFVQLHPADDNPNGDAALVEVLAIQVPPGPDEGRFYNAILEALFAPYNGVCVAMERKPGK